MFQSGPFLEEPPDPSSRTVMFSDVVSSTPLLCRIGDRAWARLIEHHRRSLSSLARSHNGVVVGFCGDGYLLVFESASEGVQCALRMQYALAVQAELPIRLGVNSGPVTRLGDDFTGLTLHLASRITNLCCSGEVLISNWTYETARQECSLPELELRTVRIRGMDQPQMVRARKLDSRW